MSAKVWRHVRRFYSDTQRVAGLICTHTLRCLERVCVGGVVPQKERAIQREFRDQITEGRSLVDLDGRLEFKDHFSGRKLEAMLRRQFLQQWGEGLDGVLRIIREAVMDGQRGSFIFKVNARQWLCELWQFAQRGLHCRAIGFRLWQWTGRAINPLFQPMIADIGQVRQVYP